VTGTVLVTGGAGFIGSHVVDELVASGWRVRSLDWLHPLAHSGEPDYLNPAADYRWVDARDAAALERTLDGVDCVCHQAAMVGLGADLGDVADYVSHNCLATAVLVRAMHRLIPGARLVLASSMVVYGEGRYACAEHGPVAAPPRPIDRLGAGVFDPACPRCGAELRPQAIPETAVTDPRSVYAATKLHQEHLCQALARETGAPVFALRYHNVYGPRMPRDTPYAGVASIFRSALEAGRPPRVFEDGGQLRDFIHVADVARANRLALEGPAEAAGTYNVATGSPRSVGQLARELARVTAGPEPVVTGEFRAGDVRHVFAAAALARDRLGFAAEVGLREGLEEFARSDLREPVPAPG
jgi:dTDP-L-rhamnose 4-epimerase